MVFDREFGTFGLRIIETAASQSNHNRRTKPRILYTPEYNTYIRVSV